MDDIPLERGGIYEIRSRNLRVGVFDGEDGLIGIREKFGERYLFTEYRNDGPYGTVRAVIRRLGTVPEDVPLKDQLGSVCQTCRTPARWTGPPGPAPWVCEGGCESPAPMAARNQALFAILDEFERSTDAGS